MRRRLGEVGGNTLCAFYLLMCRYNKGPRRIFSAAYFLSLSLSLSLQSFKMEIMIRSEPLRATISFFISLSYSHKFPFVLISFSYNEPTYVCLSLSLSLLEYFYLSLSTHVRGMQKNFVPLRPEATQIFAKSVVKIKSWKTITTILQRTNGPIEGFQSAPAED